MVRSRRVGANAWEEQKKKSTGTKTSWWVPAGPLTKRAREKTAFATPDRLYQYTVLPFQRMMRMRMMDRVLRAHRDYAAAYTDDIVIYSATWALNLHHL